jgi:fermentation-respiration switch protein FrsA (DUF1100 family)
MSSPAPPSRWVVVGPPVLLGVYGFGGLLVLLLLIENWFLYHPITAAQEWLPPPPGLNPEDVELTSADGTRLHAWWCVPRDWTPERGAMLRCPGNAGNLSYRGQDALEWMRDRHTAVLLIDYPGYGRSGGKPSEAGCSAAADAAYDWLVDEKKVPAERVLLYGESLGGAIAIDVAARRPYRALIVVSSFTSFPDMAQAGAPFLPARYFVKNKLDSLSKIGRCTGPVFIAHGTADGLVPFSQGERLFAAATTPRKRFYKMVGLDHNQIDPQMYEPLMKFLAECDQRQEDR